MEIKTRKLIIKEETVYDPITKKNFERKYQVENGFVETQNIELKDIMSLGSPLTRLLGNGKQLYLLTLKSYKQVKKELKRAGLLDDFRFELAR